MSRAIKSSVTDNKIINDSDKSSWALYHQWSVYFLTWKVNPPSINKSHIYELYYQRHPWIKLHIQSWQTSGTKSLSLYFYIPKKNTLFSFSKIYNYYQNEVNFLIFFLKKKQIEQGNKKEHQVHNLHIHSSIIKLRRNRR